MKKTKLLLPIMTVGALTAITPAVLVSCNKEEVGEFSIEKAVEDYVGSNTFNVTIKWNNWDKTDDKFRVLGITGSIHLGDKDVELTSSSSDYGEITYNFKQHGEATVLIALSESKSLEPAGTYKANLKIRYGNTKIKDTSCAINGFNVIVKEK